MKLTLDRTLLTNLRSMSDERLWHLFCGIGSSHGMELSKKRPDYKRIRGIRAVLDAATDEDLDRINRLMEIYSNAKK